MAVWLFHRHNGQAQNSFDGCVQTRCAGHRGDWGQSPQTISNVLKTVITSNLSLAGTSTIQTVFKLQTIDKLQYIPHCAHFSSLKWTSLFLDRQLFVWFWMQALRSLVLLMESSFVVRGSVIDLGLVLTLIGTQLWLH